jgi:heparan sulfate 2-O-sulfotransferase HS2ST1
VNKYFLVGVTEEVESFIELLEATLPSFFRGATKMFNESESAQRIRDEKQQVYTKSTIIDVFLSSVHARFCGSSGR